MERKLLDSEKQLQNALTASENKNKEDLDTLRSKYEMEIATLTSTKNNELNKLVSEKEELGKSLSGSEGLKSTNAQLLSKIADMEKQMKSMIPQSELDEALMLLTEADEKKDDYKQKLINHGFIDDVSDGDLGDSDSDIDSDADENAT